MEVVIVVVVVVKFYRKAYFHKLPCLLSILKLKHFLFSSIIWCSNLSVSAYGQKCSKQFANIVNMMHYEYLHNKTILEDYLLVISFILSQKNTFHFYPQIRSGFSYIRTHIFCRNVKGYRIGVFLLTTRFLYFIWICMSFNATGLLPY